MESYGCAGRGASNHQPDPGLLSGLLASDGEDLVYPDNRCPKCEADGKVETDGCWHRHWKGRATPE